MYNTGDLGQWQFDGSIKILGRGDDQVKIKVSGLARNISYSQSALHSDTVAKGFRVELDGVTASISNVVGVAKAATLMLGGELHAFVYPDTFDESAVQEHVKKSLPYYAHPSYYHALDTFPLTKNGKVDKSALRQLVDVGSELGGDSDSTLNSSGSSTAHSGQDVSVIHEKSSIHDLERDSGSLTLKVSNHDLSSPKDEFENLNIDVPNKELPQPLRGLIYRILIPYRFLFSVMWIANAAALIAFYLKGGPRDWISNLVAINLVTAVLIRQDFVINAVYTTCCSVPRSWPLWIRASCAKVYHLGGVHSSAASCASLWLLAGNINDAVCLASSSSCPAYPTHSPAFIAISWTLTAMFLTMMGFAWPPFRKANHNFFERWHRFMGWTMLALFWIQTVIGSVDTARAASAPIGPAVISGPPFWLLLIATGSVALSWFWLRRVSVISEVLSNHAIRLHFDYTVPVNGSFARVSFRPLIEWHSFATIPASKPHGPPEDPARYPAGYSLVVSNAGDWTRFCISNAPRSLWVRGVPTCGVMRIATLFNRVLVVATGSGIGPCLGHIQSPHAGCATQVFWSTRDPERSFGSDMVNSIKRSVPSALIWDTDKLGRPDMVRLCYNMAKEFRAEAVIAIANEKITKRIVYGLETRGVPAYGAIWDS